MDVATILSLIQFAIQEEPAVQTALTTLFSSGTPPTPADWQALRTQWANMSYAQAVPNSKIPTGQ